MAISLCSTVVANTGAIDCDVAPGIPLKMLIYNGSKVITSISSSANFQTFLETNSKLSKSNAEKIFVFPIVQDVADATEANTTGTLNQGFTTVLREGKPAYTFKVFAGQSLVPQLRKFNNTSVKVLIMDTNNRVWGVKSGANFIGAQAKIFVGGLKFATGEAVEEGVATISLSYLSATELNNDAAYGEITTSADIIGLIDLILTETAAKAANVYKIGVNIATSEIGGFINLYDTYSTQLASAALWEAFTGATYSTPLTITSVAADAVNSGWTVTFDATEFTALPALANIKLQLKSPPTLDAADVIGVESGSIILVK